jgi:hypothetical protein
MKTIKLSHLLFSLAVVAALVMAAIPAAPAYALSNSASQPTSIVAADDNAASLTAGVIIVCRNKVVWRDGKRISIRVCHRVHRPHAQ